MFECVAYMQIFSLLTAVNRPISFMDFNDIGSPVDSNAPTVEEAKEEQEADLITSGLPDEVHYKLYIFACYIYIEIQTFNKNRNNKHGFNY